MLNLIKFAFAMILLAGWGLAALSLHVVRTANGVQLYPKNQLSVTDTYVDVRHWTSDDETKHAAFYARLQELDKTSILDAATPAPQDESAPAEASLGSVAPMFGHVSRGMFQHGR